MDKKKEQQGSKGHPSQTEKDKRPGQRPGSGSQTERERQDPERDDR